MTGEYVDITDARYTKWLKRIAVIRAVILILYYSILAGGVCIIAYCMAPYIKGDLEWENMPFTLSQLEAIFALLAIVWMLSKVGRRH